MKQRPIKPEEKAVFAELQTLKSKGYVADFISIEKVMIEAHTCPGCQRHLEYRGFENLAETRSYGVCENCTFAELFFNYPAPFSNFTKKICQKA